MNLIPTITTERLVLRANQPADLLPFVAMWQQPVFYQYLGGQPSATRDCWQRLLRYAGAWVLLGYGYWAVEERATGEFIGAVGFADWQRELQPSLAGYPEISWVLAPPAHGRGYATEAARAVLAWTDAHVPERRTVCIIDLSNTASLALAARLGYRQVTETTFKNRPTGVLERWVTA